MFEPPISRTGFIHTVTGLVDCCTTGSKPDDVEAIIGLADRQFEELGCTQLQFVLLFDRLSREKFRLLDALSAVASTKLLSEDTHVQKAVDQLQVLLEATEQHRKMEYPGGRFQYEEAKKVRDTLFEKRAILKIVPGDIAYLFASFVHVFFDYFERDWVYERDLVAALRLLEDSLLTIEQKLRDGDGLNWRFMEEVSSGIAPISAHALHYENWPKVSAAYAELKRGLAEYGVTSAV